MLAIRHMSSAQCTRNARGMHADCTHDAKTDNLQPDYGNKQCYNIATGTWNCPEWDARDRASVALFALSERKILPPIPEFTHYSSITVQELFDAFKFARVQFWQGCATTAGQRQRKHGHKRLT
jgi:hypothetical protein